MIPTLILRDARRHYASGGATFVVAFFLLVTVLFPFAIGPDGALLARVGGGVIWAAALLAALLPVERLVGPDMEAGVLDQLAVRGMSMTAAAAAKTFAHWLSFAPPLMVAALVAAGLLELRVETLVTVEIGLAIGTPGLAALAVATGALTAGLRGAGGLAGLLLLPLALPLLIFGAGSGDMGALKLLAAVSLLLVAGLGLTASGTAAVAKVRRSVETATGVDIARLDQATVPPPPAAQAQAPADAAKLPAPADAAEPVEPPAAPHSTTTTTTTTISDDGKTRRKVVHVVRRDKDGKVILDNLSGMDNLPDVVTANCNTRGNTGPMVLNSEKDGKKHIVICSDRIELVAAKGAAIAANSKDIERKAYASALTGLRAARENMLRSPEMGAEARAQALAGIDTAIAEVEADIAKAD